MRSRSSRLVALSFALAAAALLQACSSVTTGKFIPIRESNTNHSMTSQYDVLRQGSYSRSVVGRMATTHEKGYFDFRYY